MKRWSLGVPLKVIDYSGQGFRSTVYPNPSQGEFTIRVSSDAAGVGLMEIYSIDGKNLFSEQITVNSGEQEFTLQPSLPAGIYLFRIHTPGGAAAGKLVIR
ncbi:MAG: T9SS type A sorting domain-containing protein, partial [Bacteroidales bacterium]